MEKPLYVGFKFLDAPDEKMRPIQIVTESREPKDMTSYLIQRAKAMQDKTEEPVFWTKGLDDDDDDIEQPIGEVVATIYSGTVARQFPANHSEKTRKCGSPYALLTLAVTWEDAQPKEKVSCVGSRRHGHSVVERGGRGCPPPSRRAETECSCSKQV
jgi:hypothetical protein